MYLGWRVYIFTYVVLWWTLSQSSRNDHCGSFFIDEWTLQPKGGSQSSKDGKKGKEQKEESLLVLSVHLQLAGLWAPPTHVPAPRCWDRREKSSSVHTEEPPAPMMLPPNTHLEGRRRDFSIWNKEGSSGPGHG